MYQLYAVACRNSTVFKLSTKKRIDFILTRILYSAAFSAKIFDVENELPYVNTFGKIS